MSRAALYTIGTTARAVLVQCGASIGPDRRRGNLRSSPIAALRQAREIDLASKKQASRSKPPAASGRKPYPVAPTKSAKPGQPKRPK